ncbi:MAG: hypothetical protein A2417_14290 [Bdellovibrionales bacterium RIFOXYC1_FULL_37_79]|nr:MAG: hypothetical protein A2417_14290 [Bdellovibrionales bacterium RIFOXYC1_FULL_37_79]
MFFIGKNENKIIDQDHRMLGWNNNKCMSLQSFVGGTVQITESVIGTIITAPIILLWILLGLPAPQT